MANKQDARPFIDLQKDSEEFRAKFEEDIEKCKSILDAKITDLICDPESVRNSRGLKQNALVEFSKAKYDIYISMKLLMNEMEREWLKYISEMKKLFIDNVEVFLANTKLEVKFPSTGSLLSPVGPRKSFGSKSTDVTGSIYPIISSITKNIPGFTQKTNSYDLEMERKEDDMASVYDNLKHKKNPSPLKQSSFRAPSNITDLSEDDDEEINESKQYVSEVSSRYSRKGRFTNQRIKASEISTKDAPSSESQEETSECESESTYVNSRKSNRSTSKSRSAAISDERTNNSDESEEPMETENNKSNVSSKASKRKQASKTQTNTKIQEEKVDSEPECEDFNNVSVMPETGRGKSMPVKSGKNVSVSRRGRPSRRLVVNETVIERDEEPSVPQPSRSIGRRKTLLSTTKEVASDEETSAPQPSRSVSRRKTLLPTVKEPALGSDIIPGNHASTRSKRKTIIGVSGLATETPSKRLKGSSIRNITTEEDEDVATDVNLLENGSYSEWISLKSIDGKIPTSPGIYEVKVWRAKKSAYIGFCDSLRQKLTLHKLKQNSGHKHLDKFIDRNYEDIQIRYEVVSSVNDAKVEVKNRVNSFVAQHKTTPAYN